MQGKNETIRSSRVIVSNMLPPPNIPLLNLREEVNNMVGLAKIILYIKIFRRNPQFDEFILESSWLLEEAIYFAFNLHITLLIIYSTMQALASQIGSEILPYPKE